ncbi:MAG TPA: hypothetical protein VH137_04200 [Gemmatimonadales bacterium]|jgi:hypothetical protein|nr:hypothetical protein [Gemmatimonadales bacterium]
MPVRRSFVPLALVLLAARCADQVGPRPVAVGQPPAAAPHLLHWAGTAPPQFTAMGGLVSPSVGSGGVSGGGAVLLGGSMSLSLAENTAAFWAVRGQPRSVQINYLSATGDTTAPFLLFTATDPAWVPGVGPLAPGDSVLVTVTVDPALIKVSFQPTGLQFGDSAQLQLWYGGAGGDLNGDGVVDSVDAYIESQLLGLWYREGADSAWTRIPAAQSIVDRSFTSALPHFSEYAVSW